MILCLGAPLLPGGVCPLRKLTASKSLKIHPLDVRLAANESIIVARLQLPAFFVRVLCDCFKSRRQLEAKILAHPSEGASHGGEPVEKGPVSRCIGRTKGGLNSKLHAVCDGGAALWGAKRAYESCASGGANGLAASGWLFPRYAADGDIRATAASATLNKWLGRLTGTNKTTHSFRHAMNDRLRAAGVPEDIQKALMGHRSRTVADGYGQGYPLGILRDHLNRAIGAS
jgi:hypothetical protein